METPKLNKLRAAWKNAPTGAISRVYKYGYTQQNVQDILKNGRKDESIIENLLTAIKEASKEVFKEIQLSNNKVQQL